MLARRSSRLKPTWGRVRTVRTSSAGATGTPTLPAQLARQQGRLVVAALGLALRMQGDRHDEVGRQLVQAPCRGQPLGQRAGQVGYALVFECMDSLANRVRRKRWREIRLRAETGRRCSRGTGPE